jgi:hypothetical protein
LKPFNENGTFGLGPDEGGWRAAGTDSMVQFAIHS